jgi:hypothetical protein
MYRFGGFDYDSMVGRVIATSQYLRISDDDAQWISQLVG